VPAASGVRDANVTGSSRRAVVVRLGVTEGKAQAPGTPGSSLPGKFRVVRDGKIIGLAPDSVRGPPVC
jgi:hypothetical protein